MKRASQRNLPVYVSQVSVTALADLALVLLLVFAVAVPFLRRPAPVIQEVPVIPAGMNPLADLKPAKKVVLSILPDQTLRLDGRQVKGEQLMKELKKLAEKSPETGVLVKMPSNFAAGGLARLMEEMNKAGIRSTAVEVTEPAKR